MADENIGSGGIIAVAIELVAIEHSLLDLSAHARAIHETLSGVGPENDLEMRPMTVSQARQMPFATQRLKERVAQVKSLLARIHTPA